MIVKEPDIKLRTMSLAKVAGVMPFCMAKALKVSMSAFSILKDRDAGNLNCLALTI